MILSKPFREGRARKEADVLSRLRYEITILAREVTKEDEVKSIQKNIRIIKIPFIINQRITHFLTKPILINPIYLFLIIKTTLLSSIDIFHVHDLPLAPMTIVLGILFRKKVVFDLHENYPAMLSLEVNHRSSFFRWLVSIKYFEKIELFSLMYSDAILVVCKEQAHRRYVCIGLNP